MNRLSHILIVALLAAAGALTSCSDRESYADLLREETKAVNYFLANHRVCGDFPADSVSFEIGPDAPYYRMDEDGNVYMQVLNMGDMNKDNRPAYNDLVYLRFTRYNLTEYYETGEWPSGYGNSSDVSANLSIRFGNYQSSNSQTWGEGLQLPLYFLGYNSEVNIVVRSQSGRSDEISYVTPYFYNVRYFKSNM